MDGGIVQSKKVATGKTDDADVDSNDFTPLTLEDIGSKIRSLCSRVPKVPKDQFASNGSLVETHIKEWATQLQAVLEEFNLLVCCVTTATYKWGTDRSGAADQNLGLLTGELASSQEQIASTVTPRLTNVLAPVVDLVIEKVVTTKKDDKTEIRENHFSRKLVDPDFVRLCHKILARNAPLLRQVVLANFKKILVCLKDYLEAQKNDSQTDRGFAY